ASRNSCSVRMRTEREIDRFVSLFTLRTMDSMTAAQAKINGRWRPHVLLSSHPGRYNNPVRVRGQRGSVPARSEAAAGVQRMIRRVCCILAPVFCIACAGPLIRAAEPVDFARDILPILSENCFLCHAPDTTQRQADLRLDTREGAFAKHEASFPVGAGKPDDS